MKEQSQAVEQAREIQRTVAQTISHHLGLAHETPPAFMREIARALSQGYVTFDIDTLVGPEAVAGIAGALKEAEHPLIRAAGWLCVLPEGVTIAIDELWLDEEAVHARALMEDGFAAVLIINPEVGVVGVSIDATEVFRREGWSIVEQEALPEDMQDQLRTHFKQELESPEATPASA